MLQDAVWANTAKLSDPAYQQQTVKFLAGTIKGWAYCRDHRLTAQRGLDHLCIGLGSDHPLASVAHARFGVYEYRSRVYVVHWEDGAEAARALDGRPIHLEVAIL